MGNCCRKLKNYIYPNPWEGFVVESLGYNYRTYSVSIDDVYGYSKPLATVTPTATPIVTPTATPTASPVLVPVSPSLTAYEDQPVPQERYPLLKAVIISPTTTPVIPKTPIKNKEAASVTSSPLHLGSAAVAPPPPLSLLAITKQKKLNIEY